MQTSELIFFGDIHANQRALNAALATISPSENQTLIFLGDLLTYGVDVTEVIDTVLELTLNQHAVLLRGNHDQLYDQLLTQSTTPDYFNALPPWIQEVSEWTLKQIDVASWQQLPFIDKWQYHDVFTAHANPFGVGDWRYLNSLEDHQLAADTLTSNGDAIGVFGHTHRIKHFQRSASGEALNEGLNENALATNAVHVLNAGSIGQPRNKHRPEQALLHMTAHRITDKNDWHAEYRHFNYDLIAHCQSLTTAGFSNETTARLQKFFSSAPKAKGLK